MFQNLLKLVKSVHETSIRLGAINCMRLLIKMKLALSTTNTQEVMKLLLRYIAVKFLILGFVITSFFSGKNRRTQIMLC